MARGILRLPVDPKEVACGEDLRRLRNQHGIALTHVAQALPISSSKVSNIERSIYHDTVFSTRHLKWLNGPNLRPPERPLDKHTNITRIGHFGIEATGIASLISSGSQGIFFLLPSIRRCRLTTNSNPPGDSGSLVATTWEGWRA